MIFNHPDLICGNSHRPQNMSFVHGNTKDTLSSRRDFLNSLNINYESLVCANQVHASRLCYVSEADKGKGALSADTAFNDTDGFITDVGNLPLAVFTADCLPVFIYDPVHRSIGLVHAGWCGTKEKIGPKAVQFMRERFSSKPGDLLVGFGPFLNKCCYEVGEEFKSYFDFGVSEIHGRFFLDLAGINKKQLLESGVKGENISDSLDCTYCNNNSYFSFRKEGKLAGRLMSVIMLK